MIITVNINKQTNGSLLNMDRINDIGILLSVLKNEEEIIIKPFHSSIAHGLGAVECGIIVSRLNRPLFDYQIGDTTNSCMFSPIFHRRVTLINPVTEEVILEFFYNRLPFLFKVFCKQNVRCLATLFNGIQSIGSIQQGLAFAKIWYDVYNPKRERVASLMLRKSYLRSRIQHRILEFEILDNDKTTNIGRIYPFSTHREGTEYRNAVAMKIPKDMKVEIKATLLMATLILKSRLN